MTKEKKLKNCNKIMTKDKTNKFRKEKKLSKIKKILQKEITLKKI